MSDTSQESKRISNAAYIERSENKIAHDLLTLNGEELENALSSFGEAQKKSVSDRVSILQKRYNHSGDKEIEEHKTINKKSSYVYIKGDLIEVIKGVFKGETGRIKMVNGNHILVNFNNNIDAPVQLLKSEVVKTSRRNIKSKINPEINNHIEHPHEVHETEPQLPLLQRNEQSIPSQILPTNSISLKDALAMSIKKRKEI